MKMNKRFKRILPYLKNRYVLFITAFFVWLTFFDRNDFFSQYSYRSQLKQLRYEKHYFADQTEKNKQDLKELLSTNANLEKFAREKYLMKKDEEEIFVLVSVSTKTNKSESTN